MKCVAILGDLFLKTNEISLEIKGCPHDVPRVENSDSNGSLNNIPPSSTHDRQRRVLDFDNMLVTDQMKSKIPFDFIKSRSTKYFINSVLLLIFQIVNQHV